MRVTAFMSLQVITEDHYVPEVIYTPGNHTFNREDNGTRYVVLPLRILVNPNDLADMPLVHALQDAVHRAAGQQGQLRDPDWDPVSQKQVRDAFIALFATLARL